MGIVGGGGEMIFIAGLCLAISFAALYEITEAIAYIHGGVFDVLNDVFEALVVWSMMLGIGIQVAYTLVSLILRRIA